MDMPFDRYNLRDSQNYQEILGGLEKKGQRIILGPCIGANCSMLTLFGYQYL